MSDGAAPGPGRGRIDVVLVALLALPVLAATALDGFWMARDLLITAVALGGEPSWIGALRILVLAAGLQAVLVTFRAWRGLQQAGAEPASSDRKSLTLIALLASAAAAIALWQGRAVADGNAEDGWSLVEAPWFPALRLALLAVSAASLALVPGPSRRATDQLWMRQLRGRAHALAEGARATAQAASGAAARVARMSASLARGLRIGVLATAELAKSIADVVVAAGHTVAGGGAALAALLKAHFQWPPTGTGSTPPAHAAPATARDSKGWRVLAFALLSVPVGYVLLPLALLLLEYGVTLLLMIVGILFLPLMLLDVGVLVALVFLWCALLDHGRPAPTWARVLTALGIPLDLAIAWLMRDSPNHYAYAFGHALAIGNHHVTPPLVAALVGAVLLALHRPGNGQANPPPTRRPAREDDNTALALVPWQELSDGERDAVRSLEISAEQIEFAGTTARSIDACEAGDPADVAGLAIRLGADLIGWVLLKRGTAAPDWVGAGSAVVSGFRIDRRHQGRGYGTAALDGLATWVERHWDGISTLVLRVDDGNTAGIRAYEKAGWAEVGERRMGRVGLERTMSLGL